MALLSSVDVVDVNVKVCEVGEVVEVSVELVIDDDVSVDCISVELALVDNDVSVIPGVVVCDVVADVTVDSVVLELLGSDVVEIDVPVVDGSVVVVAVVDKNDMLVTLRECVCMC